MYARQSGLKSTDDIERQIAQQQFDDLSFCGSKRAGRLFLQAAGSVSLFLIAMLFIAKVG
jgi:hypothetical protein